MVHKKISKISIIVKGRMDPIEIYHQISAVKKRIREAM